MKLIICFSCASNRSRKWCVNHFYHCIWRYFQIPSCKNYIWAPKEQNQRVPLLYYARLHEDPIPPSSTSSLSRARLLGSEISISLSSSSVSTFSNTINSHFGGDHYFNVKMHLGTKAFSTEAIWRKKQFKNPKSLSCAIAKSFCHEKNVHGLISSGSKKALFSAGIKVMVVVVGDGGAVVFTFL